MRKKRCLVVTGGGDCPGLNAVIRAIVKRSACEQDWEIVGSMDAFNGILSDPVRIMTLDLKAVAGIHFRGGTILGTTNRGGPFTWPVHREDGTWIAVDRSADLLRTLKQEKIDAIINIGGDGSQKISQQLFEKGCNIVGVPKTIDNDLSATDYTFGFQTAVEIATEAVDRLVTTASSHHRVMIVELMGRNAGWIALHAAIAAGAEVCLIPEIPYDIAKLRKRLKEIVEVEKGYAIIVIAEGAYSRDDLLRQTSMGDTGQRNMTPRGAGLRLMQELQQAGLEKEIRVTILGHVQRGGVPIAFDRILATRFGVKAFEMVMKGEFGRMVSFRFPDIISVPIIAAIKEYNLIDLDADIINSARGVGIEFGD